MSGVKRERARQADVVPLKGDQIDKARNAPAATQAAMGARDHFVQFYETDSFLINSLTGFFGTGLDLGDACIVVADRAHRERLEESLRASSRNVDAAIQTGQYSSIDDEELLSSFMVGDAPDPALFYDAVGKLIERAASGGRRVRVFGEMVARLWAKKNHSAAIRLEELWNELAERYPFSLYCAYPLRAFDGDEHGEPLFHICTGHSRVIPGESYSALYEAEDRLRAIVMLQQKAARLEAEVAERKSALIREKVARAEAENASRLKDQFLATVSHELRTPLNVIIGWATMMREGKLSGPVQQRAIETIENNARLQNRLIDDILDVSRAMSGQIRLNIEETDLVEVLNESITSVRFAAAAKKIEITFECNNKAAFLRGDANRLQQVFWNILSNAVKFTPQGGSVNVILHATQQQAAVTIADTGSGISADFIPYIFDNFRQADGSRTRKKGGLGLGLSIVRHLIELHGGTVNAASAGEGQGAVFTVTLPIQR